MRKTGIFVAAVLTTAAVALLGWEWYSLMDPADDVEPITTVVAEANARTGGLVGFLFGGITCGLAAHFFWPRDKRRIR